jgi:hypothetical protein
MNFFNEQIAFFNNSKHSFKMNNGRFTIANQTFATLKCEQNAFHSDLTLRGDFDMVGRPTVVVNTVPLTNWLGINRAYVSEDGVYEPELAIKEFARSAVSKRLVKEHTMAILAKQVQTDSHTAFLYNMLISWVRARIYQDNGATDGILRLSLSPYKDAHSTVDLGRGADDHVFEYTLQPPVNRDQVGDLVIQERAEANYFESEYVFRYACDSSAGFLFYVYHMLGRTELSAMNGEVRIPPLSLAKVLFERVSGRVHEIDGDEDIDWSDDKWIWAHIVSYVAENRLSSQFAAAYETLMCSLVQPRPSTMEATIYWQCPITIVLPPFMPTRAKIPTALTGEEYALDPLAKEFVADFSRAPAVGIARAALLNYIHWYGAYAVIENEIGNERDWYLSIISRAGGLALLEQPTTRAAVTSIITGQEVSTCMSDDCYMYINFERLARNHSYVVCTSPDGSLKPESVVDVPYIPPPVSGALITGATNAALPATYHLSPTQHIIDDIGTEDSKYMFSLRLANAYRLFGHMVAFEDDAGDAVVPWAPVHELIINPVSMKKRPNRKYTLRPMYSERRAGRCIPIPAVYEREQHPEMTLTLAKPVLVICPYGSCDRPAPPRVVLARKPKPIQFSVRSTATATYKRSEIVVKTGDQSGFQAVTSAIAPRHLEEKTIEPSGPVDITQISGDAEHAGQTDQLGHGV